MTFTSRPGRARTPLPASPLGRVRLAVVVFAAFSTATFVPAYDLDYSIERRVAGVMAVASLLVLLGVTYVRRRAPRIEVFVVGPLAVLAAIPLKDPLQIVGVMIGVSAGQALYGSNRRTVLRVLALTAALPLTVWISPMSYDRPLDWYSQAVLGLAPLSALFTAVMRVLLASMLGQEVAQRRQGLLARASHRLVGVTDPAQVEVVMLETVRDLTPTGAGLATLVVGTADLGVTAAFGRPDMDWFVGRHLGPQCRAGDPAGLQRVPATGTTELDEGPLGRLEWWAVRADDVPWMIVLSRQDGMSEAATQTLQSLLAQLALALASCASYAELTRRALHDDLTTMPNRTVLFTRTAEAVDRLVVATGGDTGSRRPGRLALMMLDLDDFKAINDTHGHSAGDDVLVAVAARLTAAIGERGLAARLGGDEFACLLEDLPDAEALDRLAADVLGSLLEPIPLSNGSAAVHVGASIGLADAVDAHSAGDLLRCSDVAMYSAKAKGKNRIERFDATQHGRIAQSRQLEDHVGHALEQSEIVVHYQPVIDLKTKRCVGVEALVRWEHPQLGLLGADRFIPMAIRKGTSAEIDRFVVTSALREAQSWQRAGMSLWVSVNVAPATVVTPGFVTWIHDELTATGLAPAGLTVELKATDALTGVALQPIVTELADLGVRVALDDFGGGPISLAALQSLHVHMIKIDRELLVQTSPGKVHELTHLIIAMSRFLNLDTVAERIETDEHLSWAMDNGIASGQGMMLGPPMDRDEIATWLAVESPAPPAYTSLPQHNG